MQGEARHQAGDVLRIGAGEQRHAGGVHGLDEPAQERNPALEAAGLLRIALHRPAHPERGRQVARLGHAQEAIDDVRPSPLRRDRLVGHQVGDDRRAVLAQQRDGVVDRAHVGRCVGIVLGWLREEGVEEFLGMRDQRLAGFQLRLQPDRAHAVSDQRKVLRARLARERGKRLGREVVVHLDEIVAVGPGHARGGARVLGVGDDQVSVAWRAVHRQRCEHAWTRDFSGGDRGAGAADETVARFAHVQGAGDPQPELHRKVLAGVQMVVHVGQPRQQPGLAPAVDHARAIGHRQRWRHLDDDAVLDQHGLVAQHAFAIHRDDVHAYEDGGVPGRNGRRLLRAPYRERKAKQNEQHKQTHRARPRDRDGLNDCGLDAIAGAKVCIVGKMRGGLP